MADKPTTVKADKIQGMIVGDVKKVTQNYNNAHPTEKISPPQNEETGPPKLIWIPALFFTALLILFMMTAFFIAPNLTPDQRNIMHLLFCLLAGFSTTFLGGSILMKLDLPMGPKGKMGISATAGIAMFIFVYKQAPFWLAGG